MSFFKQLVEEINPEELEKGKIVLAFAWYHTEHLKNLQFSAAEINQYFFEANLHKYNLTRLNDLLTKSSWYISILRRDTNFQGRA